MRVLIVAFLAILLFEASGVRIRSNIVHLDTCKGDECTALMDEVHYSPHLAKTHAYPYMVKNPSQLVSIKCEMGSPTCSLAHGDPAYDFPEGELSFLKIAQKHGTDKVQIPKHHHGKQYDPMYQKWLGKYSKGLEPFTFVEVGFSQGSSAKTWHEFLPSADTHEFELRCDQDWNRDMTGANGQSGPHRKMEYCTLHCGDGTDKEFLEKSLEGVPAPLIAVDDGGHGKQEMIDFFDNMWPKIRPGGLLFVEDLAESYVNGVGPDGFVQTYVKPLMRDLMDGKPKRMPEVSESLAAIECHQEICVFQKKAA